MAITLLQSFLYNVPMIWTSLVDDTGLCRVFSLWSNPVSVQTYSIFLFVWLYILLIVVLFCCYGKIIAKLRMKKSQVVPVVEKSRSFPETTANNADTFQVVRGADKSRANEVAVPETSANSAHAQAGRMNRSQVNVIKSMIIISVTYAVTSFLHYIGYITWAYDNNSVIDGLP